MARWLGWAHRIHKDLFIYIMNPDGSGEAQLTSGSVPSWSPTGEKIAFERNSQIFVINDDATGLSQMTTSPSNNYPSWSPGGSGKIAFASGRDHIFPASYEIYIMNEDGTAETRLTSNEFDDIMPSFSPDGSKIAFTSYRDTPEHYQSQIYVMNADGSGQIRLTSPIGAYAEHHYSPSWSPDGTKIAFASNRDLTAWQIYVINPDGTGLTQLTYSPSGVYNVDPSWSPNGKKLVFWSTRHGGPGYELYSMNAEDGSEITRLTNNSANDSEPDCGRCRTFRLP